jgi:hypothetical protein
LTKNAWIFWKTGKKGSKTAQNEQKSMKTAEFQNERCQLWQKYK